jgi:hypothetical protein
MILVLGILSQSAWSQKVTYDIRSKTGDKITAITGKARLGSFGSPSINDKGNVAYSSVISGTGIGSTTSYSVIFKKKGSQPPVLTIQAGVSTNDLFFAGRVDSRTLDDSFLVDANTSRLVYPVSGSARMFRISKDVALNNNNRIAFAGQLIEAVETDTETTNMGVTTTKVQSVVDTNYSTIGEVFVSGTTASNAGVTTYLDYSADILTRTTSINQSGGVPFNGTFKISADETLPGFAFNTPFGAFNLVATTGSSVLGLPYFTTFDSFSDAIIAKQNVCFVVAKISTNGSQFDGIWQGKDSNLQPVVTIQDKAPGGGTFSAFDGKVGPSPAGKFVAFVANTTGNNAARGVYRSSLNGSNLVSVATVGGTAPGASGDFADFTLASVNDRGKVAILGTVQTASGGTISGIWLSDPVGKNLRLMVLEGQSLTVKGVAKKITSIAFSPISGLNKNGQVAFTASFTDRTSAVVIAK